ncbi:hypothetical protein PINS_up010724 [Pythium insidiosum]|nr:hypothetical protein PINS_up010724 [Pythium insidiosum]
MLHQHEQLHVNLTRGIRTMDVVLGIDIGTTAVKCAVIDRQTHAIVASAGVETAASVVSVAAGRAEQAVDAILKATQAAIAQIPTHVLANVTAIGLCGQMHGIVWWRADHAARAAQQALTSDSSSTTSAWSTLITWEDQRCSTAFLTQCETRLRGHKAPQSSPLATGYGIASFAFTMEQDAESLAAYDSCGTIHDLIAFVLCGHRRPADATIDTTNAFSWGAFDAATNDWDADAIQALGIPLTMLPRVCAPGSIVGHTSGLFTGLGLPPGLPVVVPMGDHPCSVAAAVEPIDRSSNAVTLVNIGTSAQLAMLLQPADLPPADAAASRSFEVRPYLVHDRVLGVAAALSGGNMVAWLVDRCAEWMRELSGGAASVDRPVLYERLIALGLERLETTLRFDPTLQGERAAPSKTGSISDLCLQNGSLGDISAALCRGIVENLVHMVPRELHPRLEHGRMIGTGNALLRNPLLQHFLRQQLHDGEQQLQLQDGCDAAVGAALVAAKP